MSNYVAAAFAISARRFGVIAAARATPPLRPMDPAAASLPLTGAGVSSSLPVAIRSAFTAAPVTSAERRSPWVSWAWSVVLGSNYCQHISAVIVPI